VEQALDLSVIEDAGNDPVILGQDLHSAAVGAELGRKLGGYEISHLDLSGAKRKQ